MLHPTSDDLLPTSADWEGDEEWYDDEGAYIEEVAAVRIQSVRRGKQARSEVQQLKSSGHMLPSQELSIALVKSRMRDIAPTANGLGFAATRLEAQGLRLGGQLTHLPELRHLRHLDLSDNRLSSLDGLEHLPLLATLVCKRNRLQGVLDFPAPPGLVKTSALRHADLRGNAIAGAVSLPPPTPSFGGGASRPIGVDAHTQLEVLLLDENHLRSLRGLSALPHLTHLSAAHNQLVDTAGAVGLGHLATLELGHNQLSRCEELSEMVGLRTLGLAHNQLAAMPDLSRLACLRTAHLEHNQLRSAEALAAAMGGGKSASLRTSPLRTLTVSDNPPLEAGRPDLRLEILHLLPELTRLNDLDASPEERTCAHNMHGADADALAQTRRDYFPDRLCTAESQQLPSLMKLYRAQYTKAFAERKPIPDRF